MLYILESSKLFIFMFYLSVFITVSQSNKIQFPSSSYNRLEISISQSKSVSPVINCKLCFQKPRIQSFLVKFLGGLFIVCYVLD